MEGGRETLQAGNCKLLRGTESLECENEHVLGRPRATSPRDNETRPQHKKQEGKDWSIRLQGEACLTDQ